MSAEERVRQLMVPRRVVPCIVGDRNGSALNRQRVTLGEFARACGLKPSEARDQWLAAK